MHVSAVHADHHLQMAHEDEFLLQTLELSRRITYFGPCLCPSVHDLSFLLSTSEKKYSALWISVDNSLYNSFHQRQWIYLSLVCSKGSQAYPGFFVAVDISVYFCVGLVPQRFWQQVEVAFL